LYRLKYTVLENTGRIFEDKLQQGKSENVITRNLGNMQHRPKAWD